MKNVFGNIIKGVITTIVGTAVMVMTCIMLWTKVISFMWDGVIGLTIGCILLMAPKDVTKIIMEYIKGKKSVEDDESSTNGGEGNQKP